MPDILLYISCGLTAGLLGGYLGLGGGIVMVPFLTVIAGLDIKVAVPVSVSAIVVNSLASSNEYIKKGMVDMQLTVLLTLFMILGNITGSLLSRSIPSSYVQVMLTVILVYTAFSLLKNKKVTDKVMSFKDARWHYIVICSLLAYFAGTVAALVGIGGGVIIVPMLYLVIGVPMTVARGTSSLMIGFSAAAATTVYYLNGQIDFTIVAGVILGIMVGGKIGGYLGTIAKPIVVKVLFMLVMLYLAFKLSYEPLRSFFS